MELTITKGGSELRASAAGNRRLLTIGRDPQAAIVVDDGAVSGFHTRLTRRGGRWWLHDLDSTSGTRVNGQRVSKGRLLQHGDVIAVGEHELNVALGSAENSAASAVRGVPDPREDPKAQAHLLLKKGGSYRLKDSFLIGKSDVADLRLTGWKAPAQLAVIVLAQGGHYLVNVAGSGVLHQGKPLELRTKLNDRDRLEFQDVYATFHCGPCPA